MFQMITGLFRFHASAVFSVYDAFNIQKHYKANTAMAQP